MTLEEKVDYLEDKLARTIEVLKLLCPFCGVSLNKES